MKSLLLRLAIFLGAIALWCATWVVLVRAQPTPARGSASKLLPLLPKKGQSACYVGTFTGQALDIEDWSRTRSEPAGTFSRDGEPYMRPVPAVMPATPIHSFTLQLTYDSRKSDYDWIYNFRLLAEAEGIGTMYAAGECPWYAKDKVYGWDKREIAGSTTGMLCYIDCDGGFFDLERIGGAPALAISFDSVHGLKMKGGCGGGGIYRVKASSPSGIAFRLQTASAEACRLVETWAARK
jgi:hypothetical protein